MDKNIKMPQNEGGNKEEVLTPEQYKVLREKGTGSTLFGQTHSPR